MISENPAKPNEERRRLMARFKGKNTKPEILVRRALHAMGYRFRLHRRDLSGCPDIVLPRFRVAVMVHGCFWHQHEGCCIARVPKTRSDFWREKFRRNKARDEKVARALHSAGWKVVTIWECQAKEDRFKDGLEALLRSRSSTGYDASNAETPMSSAFDG